MAEAALLRRRGRIPDEGTRVGRELNSLGQAVVCFVVALFWPRVQILLIFTPPDWRTGARAHTHAEWSKRNSQTAEARAVQRLFAAAADRPNSSSSSTQQRRRRGNGGGQLRANEPPIVRVMTPYLGGCKLCGSVTCYMLSVGCVVSHVLCVVCWLFLAMIRA